METLIVIWDWLSGLKEAISLWAAIATIAATILAFLLFFRPSGEIKSLEEFAEAIANALLYAQGPNVEVDASLVRQVSRLDTVVRREFGMILPGSKPFVLKEGGAVFLTNGEGGKVPFGVSKIYTMHNYLYTAVNEERRQLYVGQSAVFDIGATECRVTLLAVDAARKEGAFYLEC